MEKCRFCGKVWDKLSTCDDCGTKVMLNEYDRIFRDSIDRRFDRIEEMIMILQNNLQAIQESFPKKIRPNLTKYEGIF